MQCFVLHKLLLCDKKYEVVTQINVSSIAPFQSHEMRLKCAKPFLPPCLFHSVKHGYTHFKIGLQMKEPR
jgi:hypothetical protein